jgi:hypothetical protein
MKNYISVKEDIGGETRRVDINLDQVLEIRHEDDNLTFSFGPENVTVAVLDDDLRAALATHGIVFEISETRAEAA